MYKLSALVTVLVVVGTATAQTPPGFSPGATSELGLSFGNSTISPGEQIGINGQTQSFLPCSLETHVELPVWQSAIVVQC